MKTTLLKNFVLFSGLFILSADGGAAPAQTPENVTTKKVNFGYSQNPKTKKENTNRIQASEVLSNSETVSAEENNPADETIARKTLEVVKNANKKALAPTESYKISVGDILFINLQNSSKGSTYFTVLNDGTIDYPLAGEMVSVSGLTTDEIEDVLREKIKLYENPQVSVKVREYSSRNITVLGLVEKSGEKFIQREAVPLFVERAEAVVQSKASRVTVRRADTSIETFDLKHENNENLLVIGGEIVSVGQKDYHEGLTLTQAILASGGLKRESVKKVVIRRNNADGLLVSTDYNLKLIKDGKIPDLVFSRATRLKTGTEFRLIDV